MRKRKKEAEKLRVKILEGKRAGLIYEKIHQQTGASSRTIANLVKGKDISRFCTNCGQTDTEKLGANKSYLLAPSFSLSLSDCTLLDRIYEISVLPKSFSPIFFSLSFYFLFTFNNTVYYSFFNVPSQPKSMNQCYFSILKLQIFSYHTSLNNWCFFAESKN